MTDPISRDMAVLAIQSSTQRNMTLNNRHDTAFQDITGMTMRNVTGQNESSPYCHYFNDSIACVTAKNSL